MANLNLNTLELTSTLRTAPLNGAPSSSDFNQGQRETLVDLATLVSFINNQLLPLINALPDSALLPVNLPVGIEGRTIWTDTSDQSNLFFDALSNVPLTIADTLRVINGIVTTLRQQLIDQGIEVASLQARLASTNQNDIALALQNLSSALNQISVNQQIQNIQIIELQNTVAINLQVNGVDTAVQSKLNMTGTGITIVDLGGGQVNFSLYTGTAFASSSANPAQLEVGQVLTSLVLNWTLNKPVTSLAFSAVDSHMTPSAPFGVSTSAVTQTFTGAYAPSGPITSSWTLHADDGTSTANAVFNVNFGLKNYWGPTTLTSLASADILALPSSAFATNKARSITYNCTGGRYPVYSYPATYGDPAGVLVNGLSFSDYTISVVSFTNAHGYTTNYKVVRFNNLQNGSAITVNWN